MGTNHVGACFRHARRLVWCKDIGDCEHVLPVARRDQFQLAWVTQICSVDLATELAIVKSRGRHVGDSRETELQHLVDKSHWITPRVASPDAGDHGRVLYDRQDVWREIHGDLVRITIREIARERAVTVHPKWAGVVGHDHVDACAIDGLGHEPDASAPQQERLAAVNLGAQALQDRFSSPLCTCSRIHLCCSFEVALRSALFFRECGVHDPKIDKLVDW